MTAKIKKRFYITSTLQVGHWVTAFNRDEARAAVETKPANRFDRLENSKVTSIKVVDDAGSPIRFEEISEIVERLRDKAYFSQALGIELSDTIELKAVKVIERLLEELRFVSASLKEVTG